MRILHIITDTNIGGAGRYLLNLLTQPAFQEHEVFVACPDGELAKRIDSLGIRRVAISGKDVSFSLPLVFELVRTMRTLRPDVVHTHSSLSGRIASRFLCIPVVYTKHNLVRIPSPSGRVPPPAGPIKRVINGFVAKALSQKVIAVSEGVYRDLVESGISPSLVVSIPNGIDLSPFKPKKMIQDGLRRSEGGRREIRIGTVARIHRQKALDVLVDAARIVVASEPSARFLIGGTGPLEGEIRAKIRDLKLEPYVKMAGFIEDVPGFLSGLDIYVLSSDYEGLPLAVLEAMAQGLPVVATRVGGVPEAVVDGETGFLVPPRQPKLLAQAIVRLVVDPQLAEKLGAAGRRRAEELFDAKLMAERTVEVYRQVVRKDGRRI
ncbi:MAG TPA: glycosyltransferase family 4 protein [Firmicutes bacterium]|nr:glycosyltransferase family 4 protein [Candidatus Fermentithermobacillaceae bacterium]